MTRERRQLAIYRAGAPRVICRRPGLPTNADVFGGVSNSEEEKDNGFLETHVFVYFLFAFTRLVRKKALPAGSATCPPIDDRPFSQVRFDTG